jgi:hypothetical protein
MDILDATERSVWSGVAHHGVERHARYSPELDERSLDALSRCLGVEPPTASKPSEPRM